MVSWRDLVRSYSNYKGIAILSILVSGCFEMFDIAVFYLTGQIVNVLSNQRLDYSLQILVYHVANLTNFLPEKYLELIVLLSLICLVTVIRAPIQPWLTIWFHWGISLKIRRNQLHNIMGKILNLPLTFYDEHNPGRIANRIAKGIENQTWMYPEIAGQFFPKIIKVLGIFLVISLISWKIALFFLASFILIFGFSLKDLKQLIKQENIVDKHIENTQSRTSEIVTNIKTVKAFATEKIEFKRQNKRVDREFKYVMYRLHKGYVDLTTWQKTVIQFSFFVVLLYTLIDTVQGKISLGHFITVLTISSIAYAELEPLTQLLENFSRRYTSMIRLQEFIKIPSGKDAANLVTDSLENNTYKFTGKIHFDQMSFGYDINRPILININLLIEPCQTVALVGKSGSGKSTLLKLLFRYFEPNEGKILIDGQDINTLNISYYRRRLAIVHQEVDIFNGNLLDNLTYGNPTVSFEQVITACQIAKVDEFIEQLPHGYYTIVGERGVRLSGGQRQRLGIARALIVDPDVLIFDEATSSLDYESERAIQLAMSGILGTRTTIIIAHRLSTVREADKIVVLDGGRIVEVGNHEELLNQQGIYHRLHSLQETGELY